MRDIVVVFAALAWEAAAVRRALRNVVACGSPRGWVGARPNGGCCLLVQTGIGPERAAAAAAAVPDDARAFLALGCAGGLAPALRTGDLVLASEIVQTDADGTPQSRWPARGRPVVELENRTGLVVHLGPLASSPVVLRDADAKARFARRSGAVAVAMEDGPLAAAAAARGLPFAAVRTILDEAHEAVPELSSIVDLETGDVRLVRAALELPRRPEVWRALIRLGRQQRRAAASLRAAAKALLGSPGRMLA